MTHVATVEVRGLRHAFAGGAGLVAVLDGVDLSVPEGAFVTIVGPSGCGKSTLLRVLAGLLTPDGGEARISGESTVGRPGLAGFMPQRDLLLPWKRAIDNATLGAEVAGTARGKARDRALRLFPTFGLGGFENAWPSQLSGGMRQRLALLRTFLLPARVLLLDEPFGALDAITRGQMQRWLEAVWIDDRRTVILVTHDVEEALVLSDRVEVMSQRPGRMVASLEVGLPRPREATDPGLQRRRAELLSSLRAG